MVGAKGKGIKKRIKTYYIHIPTPHEECDHVLQTCTNKNKKEKVDYRYKCNISGENIYACLFSEFSDILTKVQPKKMFKLKLLKFKNFSLRNTFKLNKICHKSMYLAMNL